MNLDLISIYERNKKIEKKENELKEQAEINSLIRYVLDNISEYQSANKKLFDKIGFKYTKKTAYSCFGGKSIVYNVKFNKANIKLLQDYIKELGEENE